MSELLRLFAHNILPVFLAASAGFALQRRLNLDPRPLSQAAFYVLAPALVFGMLLDLSLDGPHVVRMMAVTFAVILLTGAIGWGLGRALRLGPELVAGVMLALMFMNAGNFGLSVNLFAFGETGLAWATIYFVAAVLLTNSVGVYIAARGRTSAREAVLGLARVPALYAILLALLVRGLAVDLPVAIARPIEVLGIGAVPVMLLVLGMQIGSSGLPARRSLLAGVSVLKLIAAPVLALLIVGALGLSGVPRQVAILESSMPTAVMSTILAITYDVEAEFVTGAVLLTTALSPITLTVVLALLQT